MPEPGAKAPEVRAPGPRVVLGFDYGRRRLGVAVGQELTRGVQPLAVIPWRSAPESPWPAADALVAEWRPQLLVVGVSRRLDGGATAVTRGALAFAHRAQKRWGLAVETVDERLTSVAAEALRPKSPRSPRAPIDDLAAAVMLQGWFADGGTPLP